jgi:iron(III) transport system substrate-binding protein
MNITNKILYIFLFLFLNVEIVLSQTNQVNIYSYRQPQLIQPLLDEFTKDTGIKTNILYASSGLVEKMIRESNNGSADILLTVGIGRLIDAVNGNIAQRVNSRIINENIPEQYRDKDGMWVGLTARSRVIFASKERVTENDLTYEDLSDEKWFGRICSRSGQHEYNLTLFSSLLLNNGEEKFIDWLEGLRNNLAVKPQGNDREQVKRIYSGLCDISLGNSYYMAQMLLNDKEPEQKDWANSVKIIMPNSNERGTHIDISGAIISKYAPNKDNAFKLLEFLTTDKAQRIYAELNHEYPLKRGTEISTIVSGFGVLNADKTDLLSIAERRSRASRIVDIVNFDN